eukprot:TRINITY_DN3498_c0_g2_i1.p1 TRINITY_DN3498_c0_g2~~TRINITY_DN3498_c0_g2_i1.p1  ORF type:complete len:604 (+),score=173.66 TRINITY_DN3498_c0_g2_i1:1-1812(+)
MKYYHYFSALIFIYGLMFLYVFLPSNNNNINLPKKLHDHEKKLHFENEREEFKEINSELKKEDIEDSHHDEDINDENRHIDLQQADERRGKEKNEENERKMKEMQREKEREKEKKEREKEKEKDYYVEDTEWLYPVPDGVAEQHKWRYSSKGLYFLKRDELFRKFENYNKTIKIPTESIENKIKEVETVLLGKNRKRLAELFRNAFSNKLEKGMNMLHDGTVFLITGDIPLMWLRDSSAQLHPYMKLAKDDPYLQIIIEGTLRRNMLWIKQDVYGSSFRMFLDFDHVGKNRLTDWDFQSGRTIHVAMHNYEIDSLCYFLRMSHHYYEETGVYQIFDEEWVSTAELIVDNFILEQNHGTLSKYSYPELSGGQGPPVCVTNLTWGGFRPSDDKCTFHFNIPQNMFVVTAMEQLEKILKKFYPAKTNLLSKTTKLKTEIDDAIHKHAVFTEEGIGKMYAYEIDGCGSKNLMDDANVPSLLSIDYLGYKSKHDPDGSIAKNTRNFILSKRNPFYFCGQFCGIGSPHTNPSYVWPMSLIIQAITEEDPKVINNIIDTLEKIHFRFGMHESVNVNSPQAFSRDWFCWANALFAEMIMKYLDIIPAKPQQ